MPPARRRLPDPPADHTTSRASLPSRDGALFVPVITSPHNETLKLIRKLARRRERDRQRLFVAEGEDLLRAATAARWPPVSVLVAAQSGLEGTETDADLLASVSSLGSGTRAIGIYSQKWSDPSGPLCVYLHNVSDPGNVGAILRSAAAFGASSVALGPLTADPYSPKAVRASMGAVFSVPVARASVTDVPASRVALVAEGGNPLAGAVVEPLTLVVGSEREGLPPEVLEQCDVVATIPTLIHSLNAATATSIALYELTRHRMAAP
jgi:TrmH family RNA methyltransferase